MVASLDRKYNLETRLAPQEQLSPSVSASGMGIVVSGAESCQALCNKLMKCKDSLDTISHLNLDGFLGQIGSFLPNLNSTPSLTDEDLEWMDRATLLTSAAFEEAISNSAIDLSKYDPRRIAVVIGSSHSGLIRTEEVAKALISGDFDKWSRADRRKLASSFVSNSTSVIARLAGSKGRAITISSACASSNSAVGIGADLIRSGEADVVICGGCDTISLSVLAGFNALRALSADKTSPFSKVVGLNVGEGAGIAILEKSERISEEGRESCFEVIGYGLSGDAHHATAPDSEGRGAEAAMRAALFASDVSVSEIDYINAHGTGTDSNDIAEARAYRRVFGNSVPISSLKSFFGHTLGASGIVELISSVVVAKNGYVPANLRLDSIRDGCEGIDLIANKPRAHKVQKMLVNNYGFGGNNSSLCIGMGPSGRTKERTLTTDGVGITGIGSLSIAGNNTSAIIDRLTFANGGVTPADVDISNATIEKPNFRTPELKKFARIPLSTKLELSAIGQALGDDADIYNGNPKTGLISGRVFGAQKPTEEFMKSVFSGDASLASAHHFPMTTMNASVGQCSIAYGIRGYVTAICGGASALGYALDLVKWGRQDRIVVSSGDETTSYLNTIYGGSDCLGDCCPSEAGAAIGLERNTSILQRSGPNLAQITAWSILQDGVDIGPAPTGQALQQTISDVLTRTEKTSAEVDQFIEILGPSKASRIASKKAKKQMLSGLEAKILDISKVVGFLPSSGCTIAVATATELLQTRDDFSSVLVFGTDVIGDSFSFMLERNK